MANRLLISGIAAGLLLVATVFLVVSTASPNWKLLKGDISADIGSGGTMHISLTIRFGLWQYCAEAMSQERCSDIPIEHLPKRQDDLKACRGLSVVTVIMGFFAVVAALIEVIKTKKPSLRFGSKTTLMVLSLLTLVTAMATLIVFAARVGPLTDEIEDAAKQDPSMPIKLSASYGASFALNIVACLFTIVAMLLAVATPAPINDMTSVNVIYAPLGAAPFAPHPQSGYAYPPQQMQYPQQGYMPPPATTGYN